MKNLTRAVVIGLAAIAIALPGCKRQEAPPAEPPLPAETEPAPANSPAMDRAPAANAPEGDAAAPEGHAQPGPAAEGEDEAVKVARANGTPTTAAVQKTPSGLRYIDAKVGTGESPKPGQNVTVHYTGWLTSGQKFDSSRDRGSPFTFALGVGQVIKGWDEGVATMKPGGIRKLIIPPDLGYGASGSPGAIPPNATLVFDVELLKVE